MKYLRVLMILLLVSALLAACAPAVAPEQTTGTEDSAGTTAPTTLPIPDALYQPKEYENSVFRFLQETNHSGTIIPNEETVPPGTLPEVWRIPQPEQDLVGQTVNIVLAKDQDMTPFYFCCTEAGVESLYVFLSAKIPMLILFETHLGGIKGLYDHIQNKTVFQGKIYAMVNVSYEEGNVYAYNACYYQEDIPENEILNNGTDLIAGKCMGVVGYRETADGPEFKMLLKGAGLENVSAALKKDFDWMYEKLERFGLVIINS